MTQNINSILWTATSQVNTQNISVQKCDSGIDSDWKFVTEGTDQNGSPFQAAFAIVDNFNNTNSCTIIMGQQSYGVSPFTRRTFALPDPTPICEIQVTSGIVTLTLCQSNMNVPDEQNQLASSGGGDGTMEYNPFFNRQGLTPVAGELFLTHFFERAVMYQNNFNGIEGGVSPFGVLPLSNPYNAIVYKNAVHVGDLYYYPSGAFVATTVGGSTGTFAVGDCMSVIGQGTPDGQITGFSATWAMTPA